MGWDCELFDFLDQVSYEEFYDNKLNHDTRCGRILVREGSKVIKAFKHFISNEEQLRYFQDRASTIVQEDCIEGELCISVNPLDYLTVSENRYKWRSCHALDGDYRSGNLQYMMDSSTVVAYIKGEQDFNLGGVYCSNKKWRVLLFLDTEREVMFAGRQYPFNITPAMNEILNNFSEYLIGSRMLTRWTNASIKYFNNDFELAQTYCLIEDRLFGLEDMVWNSTDRRNNYALYFSDLLESSDYIEPYFTYHKYRPHPTRTPIFDIGNVEVPCLICGEVLDRCGEMYCYNCDDKYENENFFYCEDCGTRIAAENATPVIDENGETHFFCEDCIRVESVQCSRCGKLFLKFAMSEENPEICKTCEKEINAHG